MKIILLLIGLAIFLLAFWGATFWGWYYSIVFIILGVLFLILIKIYADLVSIKKDIKELKKDKE